MKKISKTELLAILAVAGVSGANSGALAANLDSNSNDIGALGKSEHSRPAYLADNSSCGKGSCGKDEKGAAAAKEKKGKTKKDAAAADAKKNAK